MADVDVSVVETVTVVEFKGVVEHLLVPLVYEEAGVADVVSTVPGVATTVVRGMASCTVSGFSTDFYMSHFFKKASKGIPLKAIVVKPGTGGSDVVVVRDGGLTGPIIYYGKDADGVVPFGSYGGALVNPVIDVSECTFTAGASITFIW